MQVLFSFDPDARGEYVEELAISYDSGEQCFAQLQGAAAEVDAARYPYPQPEPLTLILTLTTDATPSPTPTPNPNPSPGGRGARALAADP